MLTSVKREHKRKAAQKYRWHKSAFVCWQIHIITTLPFSFGSGGGATLPFRGGGVLREPIILRKMDMNTKKYKVSQQYCKRLSFRKVKKHSGPKYCAWNASGPPNLQVHQKTTTVEQIRKVSKHGALDIETRHVRARYLRCTTVHSMPCKIMRRQPRPTGIYWDTQYSHGLGQQVYDGPQVTVNTHTHTRYNNHFSKGPRPKKGHWEGTVNNIPVKFQEKRTRIARNTVHSCCQIHRDYKGTENFNLLQK